MRASIPDGATTDDAVLGGRLRLIQPRAGHRTGHDAILLAAATDAKPGDHAVELGAGVGAAGLALAVRVPALTVSLVDIDETLVALAALNAERNGLSNRVRAIAIDVHAPATRFAAAGLPSGDTAWVLMNPPFNDPSRQQVSPDPGRRRAHAADPRELQGWVAAAERLLRAGGSLTLIWRAAGVGDVLAALAEDFGAIEIIPVHPRPGAAAIRVLIRATKGSHAPLSLLPGLVLNDANGRPSAAAEAVLRHGATLPLTAGK
jgi:tRNA1(Val) A37 N6-methylase TrmN6